MVVPIPDKRCETCHGARTHQPDCPEREFVKFWTVGDERFALTGRGFIRPMGKIPWAPPEFNPR